MDRDKWYEMYSAARMLTHVRFPKHMAHFRIDNRGSEVAWQAAYDAIESMGYGIKDAVFAGRDYIHPIKEHSWAVSYNHKICVVRGR